MLTRIIAATTAVSATMLIVLLITTTPSSAGPLGILGFFVFMYLTALGVLTFLFRGASVAVTKSPLVKFRRPRASELSLRGAYYYASVIALVPVMLIAMQSVGRVGPYQIALVVFFAAIAWLYVTNRMT